ncbi:aminoacyl-tRNA deacylase [Paracoccus aminophilus]|uniref:Cys-tRNA(Pro)/Cys-tRNA(Cys) deacylase n=1 Tax=Paracoccus aminophilus JCM 7686 TaxID=1367847 RepID=S5YC59_PARAH|nr:aminoacyl-tRNA deacylase [Paracoccus aminophilus]AGT09023.1 hypothetical protein JCM7686_1922 [Paracoccus aminophilus JCM 7686]
MSTATLATRALTAAKVTFRVMEYDYVAGQEKIGLHAAEAIGVDPARVLKTLMVEVDGKPACAVIPSDRSLSMKRVAQAFGGKSAAMMPPDKAERLTGFHTGGISPFGQKRRVPAAFEASALGAAEIVLNGGKRGLMVALAPGDALAVSGGAAHPLISD